MIETGGSRRWRGSAQAFPSIEPDVVMITAGRNECRLPSVTLGQLKTEHATIKAERAFEIRNPQVNMANPRGGMNG